MQLFIISAIYILESVITLWFATLTVKKTSSFRIALPLILASFALSMGTALFLYDLLLTNWHLVFTLLYITSVVIILVVQVNKIFSPNENNL